MPTTNFRHCAAGIAWSLAFAYLAVEIVTAYAWKSDYSFRHDTISDLGVTACTPHMCSPLHLLMNATFVALGLLTIMGAVLFRGAIPHGYRRWWIVSLAVLTGLSTAATGLVPSNDGIVVHLLAVLPAFVSRHLVLILVAVWLWKSRRIVAVWSALCAISGLVGTVLLVGSVVQIGISERLVLYPLPAFMAVTGAAVLSTSLTNAVARRRTRHSIVGVVARHAPIPRPTSPSVLL
ncbi:DUF998 domain-containing protein [Antrihabitans sp. YC2-6]|uniref:DUF998 domain-containing protein n=1 Tax=Antrihabitans sp. YC2-6 TaxID=2799498 RepID=UPI0018F73420|nr:DUF998 domain-containing protein [Antrihabitans sp. YC2-6]MBJ8347099.1 DUF998 domain-containing protein [Antrihabitans sp. YC2-6]